MPNGRIHAVQLGWVNAYLIQGDAGQILVDTGPAFQRSRMLRSLEQAGCGAGSLKLIVLTHADPDHAGNAAFLRAKYEAKIAAHPGEKAALEQGDMFLSRGPLHQSGRLLRPFASLFRLRGADRLAPDVLLQDGDRLDPYGVEAEILHVPGHSIGSVAVLTAEGDLLSGDFLENRRRPSEATLVDDKDALRASYDRVMALHIRRVYPGHGRDFLRSDLVTFGWR